MKRLIVVVICGAAAVAAMSPFAEGGPGPHTLRVVERLGPDVTVPPGQVRESVARCPRGYVAVAGMEFLGALDEVSSLTTSRRNGWVVDLGNPTNTPLVGSAGVECLRGRRGIRVRKAMTNDQRRQAIRDWKASIR